ISHLQVDGEFTKGGTPLLGVQSSRKHTVPRHSNLSKIHARIVHIGTSPVVGPLRLLLCPQRLLVLLECPLVVLFDTHSTSPLFSASRIRDRTASSFTQALFGLPEIRSPIFE